MRAILVGILIVVVISPVAYPLVVKAQSSPELYFPHYDVRPGFITPSDPIEIIVNVTSSSALTKVVSLFITNTTGSAIPPGQRLNYTQLFMIPETSFTANEPQTWVAFLHPQGKPTTLAFYFQAANSENLTVRYPPAVPLQYAIQKPPSAYFGISTIGISSVTIGRSYSSANITFSIQGEFPNPPRDYPISVSITSIPHGYGDVCPQSYLAGTSSRFWYSTQFTCTTELSGSPLQYPFDSYVIGLTIGIQFPNATFGTPGEPPYKTQLFPVGHFASGEDQWNFTELEQTVNYRGNYTNLAISYQVTRLNPTYPTLLLVGLATFVLIAGAALLDIRELERKLDVYLAAIVISVSVIVGVRLNPFGFGVTIYEEYFSFIILSIAAVTFASVIAYQLRSHRSAKLVESLVGLGLLLGGEVTFLPSNMPVWGWIGFAMVPAASLGKQILERRIWGLRME